MTDQRQIPVASLFRFWHPVQVRYADLDTMRHVNNVTMIAYLESARMEYLRQLGLTSVLVPNIALASLRCDYLAPGQYEQSIRVGVRTTRFGRTSFDLEYLVLGNDTPLASALTVMVYVEPGTTKPQPLTDHFRRLITEFEQTSIVGANA